MFAAGLDGTARPDAAEWCEAFAQARRPPAVEALVVDQQLLLEGDELTIEWEAPNADYVLLHPGGRGPASGRITATLRESVRVEVRAVNAHGESVRRGPLVTVVPLPRLEFVGVPRFPGLRISVGLGGVAMRCPPAIAPRHGARS